MSSSTARRRPSRQPRTAPARPTSGKVVIELSATQIACVARAGGDAGSVSLLLAGLTKQQDELATKVRALDDRRLSRSLLTGLSMLLSFPSDNSYIGVAELAALLGMHVSTTHRYVSTLTAAGLVEQDPDTRRYRLCDMTCRLERRTQFRRSIRGRSQRD
jgi:hypothetical protein